MESQSRTSFLESEKSFWLFAAWAALLAGLFFYKIPPHTFKSARFLFLSFQYSTWSWEQVSHIWFNHFLFCTYFIGTMIVFLGTGNAFLDFLGVVETFSALERWVWSLALGLTFWGLLAEGLAFENLFYIGLLKPVGLLSLAIVLFTGRWKAVARCWPFHGKWEAPLFWKLAVLATALLSICNLLAPEMSWDAMTYQLILPAFYFKNHGFYPVTGMVPAQSPSLGQMFFSWGLLWDDDSLARSFSFLAHLGTALALVGIGNRLGHSKAGSWGALLYWVFPYFNLYSTRGYVDLFTGFYATLGLGALAIWAVNTRKHPDQPAKRWGYLGFLGIFSLSCVWGIKYNAVSYWLAGAVILCLVQLERRIKALVWLGFLAGPFFFFGPWALKSFNYVGNPFYPHLADLFHTFDWTPFDQSASTAKFHNEGWRGLLKIPLMPWTVFFENYSGAPNEEVSLLPMVAAPLVFFKGWRSGWKPMIWIAVGIPFLIWTISSQQLRLISAVFALAALLWGEGFGNALQHWPGRQMAVKAIFGFFLWICVGYLFQGLVQQPNPFPNFAGVQSKEQFLGAILRPGGYAQMTRELNQKLPPDARVLILGQQNGYYLDRISAFDFDYTYPVLKKMSEESSTPEGLYRKLREKGFTHILYNYNGMRGSAVRVDELGVERYPWKPEELKNYEQFFLRFTRRVPLEVGEGYSLYEIVPRKGFSSLPEDLPGTELYYLKIIQSLMQLPKLATIIGKNIPADVYVSSYQYAAEQYPEFGYPCFQWAFAVLSVHPELSKVALKAGQEGYRRNGDEASWLDLQGSVALIQKHFSKAISLLEAAQKLSPERVDIPGNLAVAYYNERNFPKAIEEIKKAEFLDPSSKDYPNLERQLQDLLTTKSGG